MEEQSMKRAVALIVASIVAVPALASAASLDIKPGLWEVQSTIKRSGTPPIPDSVMAKLTPDQREKLEAALKARAAQAPKDTVTKSCITEKDLEKPMPLDPGGKNKDCKSTLVKSSRTMQMIHVECTGQQNVTGDWKFQAIDTKSMIGTMDMKVSAGTHTMTVNGKFQGKWLQASCETPKTATK
jgi:Protein of unknown function (DUF3617)